jgi:hypothetical protein
MKRKRIAKIALSRQTLRVLTPPALGRAGGADSYDNCPYDQDPSTWPPSEFAHYCSLLWSQCVCQSNQPC